MQVVEIRKARTRLVVADAGVDQDAAALGLQKQGMDAKQDFVAVVDKGAQPFAFALERIDRRVGRDHCAGPVRFLLAKQGDFNVANIPMHSE